MRHPPSPPRLARWIVERALPADLRDGVSGDLDEMYRRRVASLSMSRARFWYWRQAASFFWCFLADRLRGRWRRADISTGISWLDVKLGFRMLLRYPGLTLVGGLGLAVAIAVSATAFTFFFSSLHPTLPLDEGERIVGLENWDTSWNNQEDRSLHDFVAWRDELKSVEDVSAFRNVVRNLSADGGQPEQLAVAEMTVSGFRVARVAPLLGRPLIDGDERPGAPAVAVIGHDAWTAHFAADPAVVGRTVRIGAAVHTIVGVMPAAFAFPINHRVWVPLRADPLDYERRRGPALTIFGRLTPGATLDSAQAELTGIGRRMAIDHPKTHQRLRPRVVHFTELWFDDERRSDVGVLQALVTMLVVVVGVNVAILVYARTATRQGEILVRSALGASRRRIVGQLFVEALVLSTVAAAAGLVLAAAALRQADAVARQVGAQFGGLPFWMTFELSSGAVLYVAGLAVLAAVIAGVVPAFKATGRRMQSRLSQLGGGTGMRLGMTWTVLIVLQVAFAVTVLPGAVYFASQAIQRASAGPGFAAEEFVTARVLMDRDVPITARADAYVREFDLRYETNLADLVRRVEAEPAVSGVTHASSVPGDEVSTRIEIEGTPSASGGKVRVADVGVNFFEVFGVRPLAGRWFEPGDLESAGRGAPPVIVNHTFVRQFLGSATAVGRRIRHVEPRGPDDPAGRWHEIVGVVSDLPANPIGLENSQARLYHPSRLRENGTTLMVRTRTADSPAVVARLREISTAVDPMLRLTRMLPLDEVYRLEQAGLHWGALAFALVTLSVLLLSAAGIYALVSVTVTRRRKEIGIRMALGGDAGRVLRDVLSRALVQVSVGIALGAVAAALLDESMNGELMGGHAATVLPVVAVVMMTVGFLAALGPARRGLRIEPTIALREE